MEWKVCQQGGCDLKEDKLREVQRLLDSGHSIRTAA